MTSNLVERAVRDAARHGNALLKFVSANDAGATGAHQAGFYLPKAAWRMYSSHAPTKGRTLDDLVQILWPDGRITKSRVTWYGAKTRSEYRLTRFGRRFPFLRPDRVGDLFVLIPTGRRRFSAYVFGSDDEIAEIQSALGIEIVEGWGLYQNRSATLDDPAKCEGKLQAAFVDTRRSFPTGDEFSEEAATILEKCHPGLQDSSPDQQITRVMDVEYRLFKAVEAKLCAREAAGPFNSIDHFLSVASTIMNRRKSRAGRSLENHVGRAMERLGLPFDFRAREIEGVPDIIVPGVAQYQDPNYSRDKVFLIAVKTTCRDRWGQVLKEGPLVKQKYLLTMQPGISDAQVALMAKSGVQLVVPEPLHGQYPPKARGYLWTVVDLFDAIRRTIEV